MLAEKSNDKVIISERTKKLAKTPQKRLLTAFNRTGGILYHPMQNNLLKRIIMNTKEFLLDLCDVINNNSEYMTIEKFREKYKDLQFSYDSDRYGCSCISICDKDYKNEWLITANHVYASKWNK